MKNTLFAYFGHHKCSTRWILSIIVSACASMGLKWADFHNPGMFDHDLRRCVEEAGIEFLSYTNANYDYVTNLDNFRGFHVIRDPRDIVLSSYFSHRYSHSTKNWSELKKHRAKLRDVSKDEGLLLEMKFREREFNELYNWNYMLPNVLEVRFEDLTQSPYKGFIEIFRYLGCLHEEGITLRSQATHLLLSAVNRVHKRTKGIMPLHVGMRMISAERLLGIVHDNRFSRKAGGRKHGEEDTMHHYRKGIGGDWVNHFTPDHIGYFKKHYNDVLIKMGYEGGDEW